MRLTFSQDKIIALMGRHEPDGSDECRIAMHIIDALLENKESYEKEFGVWTTALAVEVWCDDLFLSRQGLDAGEIDWEAVHRAVGEALSVLKLPTGVTLVASDSWRVFACGGDLDAARNHLQEVSGVPLCFESVTRKQHGHYIVVRGPMPAGGWEADDAERVLKVGEIEDYLLAREIAGEAA